MLLSDILNNISYIVTEGSLEKNIASLASDSAKVTKGGLFAAIVGTHVDGHTFIDSAIQNGATVIVCEKMPASPISGVTYVQVAHTPEALGFIADMFYGHPSQKLALVGVTGTNGKTTIATVLYKLFESLGYKAGLFSTVENRIHETVLPATQTTPDLIVLHELLAKMVDEGITHCFMEVSSHAVDQNRIAGLHFTGGIFTNLTHDHLDYHKTFEAYFAAKKKFFDDLSETAFALTNKNDAYGEKILADTRAKKYTYGEIGYFSGKIVSMNINEMALSIENETTSFELVGKFNMYNILAIYGTAVLLGEEKKNVLAHLSKLQGATGRFHKMKAPNGSTVIVDYAHSPDALQNVLETIRGIIDTNGRIITVVGCGGDRDPSKRAPMGSIAAKLSDAAIFTADNPRSEDPAVIISSMGTSLTPDEMKKVATEPDRRKAIDMAVKMAQSNDVVLIAGKGHELYQEIKGFKQPFSDFEVVEQAFRS